MENRYTDPPPILKSTSILRPTFFFFLALFSAVTKKLAETEGIWGLGVGVCIKARVAYYIPLQGGNGEMNG